MPDARRARLIEGAELAERLADPHLAVLEVARDDDDAPFREAHIPGSRWAFWKRLLWHETDRQFPDPATLAQRLGALGVASDTTLVLSGDPIQFGTYAFWVMQMCGHRDLLLLDGGRAAWLAAGLPVESGPVAEPHAEHTPGVVDEAARAGRDDVLAAVRRGDRVLVDLRSPEEYRGDRVAPYAAPFDHGAERKGHIPGARHLHYQRLLHEDGSFRSLDELRAAFADVDIESGDDVITYCRLSHRGTLGWFVLSELLGHDRVQVYDGSWTEWGSIVGVPVER
ncbi:MAG: sulfurtransferase [Solirubrobacteraceae bacterium]